MSWEFLAYALVWCSCSFCPFYKTLASHHVIKLVDSQCLQLGHAVLTLPLVRQKSLLLPHKHVELNLTMLATILVPLQTRVLEHNFLLDIV
jgi:hypothetical protein